MPALADHPDTPVARLEAAVRARIGAARYQMWFLTRAAFATGGGGATVHVPDDAFRDWLEDRFGEALREATAEVLGGTAKLRFQVSPERFGEDGPITPVAPKVPEPPAKKEPLPKRRATLFGDELDPPAKPPRGRKVKAAAPAKVEAAPVPAPAEPTAAPRNARRWRSLSEFVVGTCNRLAHASVQSILEGGDDAPNPLVIHGPVGTGKTHLLCATLKHLALELGARVAYVEISLLYAQIRRGFQDGKSGGEIIQPLSQVDVLAIDELGKGRGSPFELETLDELIARRYNAGKVTLFATNYSLRPPEENRATGYATTAELKAEGKDSKLLCDRVGERVYSRLCEMCEFVEFSTATKDYRRARATVSRPSKSSP